MVDYALELVIIPVSDVDAVRAFYGDTLGWPVDFDETPNEQIRFVQVTPPGSACSIAFGRGLTAMEPGTVRGLQVVVTDIEAAHADLTGRGVAVSAIDDQPWGRFVQFADPDGNAWSVQEMPGRR